MHGMNRFKNIQEASDIKPGTHQQQAVHLHRQQETERPDISEELIWHQKEICFVLHRR